MSPGARRALAKRALDGSQHRARGLTWPMVQEADLIVCMTQAHLAALLERFPQAKAKRLVAYDISDPYGLGPKAPMILYWSSWPAPLRPCCLPLRIPTGKKRSDVP